jgi:DNA end-binding protein Ku
MAATVWSGYLTFGLISLPVRLYSGARGSRISFHMLHKPDLSRVKQQLWCPVDEKVVERNEIVKGYEFRRGEYVVVEPQELKAIEPKTAKAMEIVQFVKAEEVDPIYFESSYYVAAEDAGKRPYALLAQAMRESGYMALAQLTMHNREYTVFLRPFKDGLALHTMYYADEVRSMEHFGPAVEVKETELKVAHQLIEALAAKFEPERFHDHYEENLRKLIDARLEGKQIAAVERPAKLAPVVDLMDALRQSLARMDEKKAGAAGAAQETERAASGTPRKQPVAIGKKPPERAKPKRKRAA